MTADLNIHTRHDDTTHFDDITTGRSSLFQVAPLECKDGCLEVGLFLVNTGHSADQWSTNE